MLHLYNSQQQFGLVRKLSNNEVSHLKQGVFLEGSVNKEAYNIQIIRNNLNVLNIN